MGDSQPSSTAYNQQITNDNNLLGSLDFGGGSSTAQPQFGTGGFGGDPFGNKEEEPEADIGGGWANMGAFGQ